MKKLISHDLGTCVFAPTGRTLTFSGVTLALEQILLVENTTANVIIYLPSNPATGGTLTGSVLTLDFDTSAMAAGDALQIWVDVPDVVDSASLYAGAIAATGAGAALDTSGFAAITVQLAGVWSGVVFIEGSNDATAASWSEMMVMSLDELSMQDAIAENGQYSLKTTTRYIRYNVVQLAGTISASVIGRTSEGVRAVDRMALALDDNSGVTLQVGVKNLSRDTYGGLFLSDAAQFAAGSANVANKVLFTMDTSGYQSVALQLWGTFVGTVTFQASNDGATWVSVAGWNTALAVPAALSTTVSGIYSIPCVGKLFRANLTAWTSGLVQGSAYLRNQPAVSPTGVNISQVLGTAVPSAGVAGVMPVAGNTAVAAVPTSYPVIVAGVDSTGKTRQMLLDALGQTVQPSVPAPMGIQNLTAQAVVETALTDGQSIGELLAQILIELRIANWYNYDLPRQLQTGVASPSDEPAAFRNDPTSLTT